MAYENYGDFAEGEGSSTSQTSMGLATNPLMPMGDPLAYARMGANPEMSVPGIQTQGMRPQPVAQPGPINVPQIEGPHGGGADPSTNQLQPQEAPQDPNNLGSLQQLMQLRGMESLMAPSAPGAGLVPAPGAGAGPGRRPTGAVIEKAAEPYKETINSAAAANNVDSGTLTRLLYQESQFNPNAVSPAGARGLGQFMPATARDEGVDVKDPKSSINGAAKYLAKMTAMFNGNAQLGMAAYNWGPGNVHNWLKNGGDPSKLPAETRDYVNIISGRPLAPNMKAANAPSAAAAPMAAMIAGEGGFVAPGSQQNQTEQQVSKAPGFGRSPKPGDLSPLVQEFNRPPGSRSEPTPGVSPLVQEFNKPPRGPPIQGWPPEQGVYAPPPTVAAPAPAATAPPEQSQGQGQVPQTPGQTMFGQGSDMQRLWRYMLIKSLFPQIQFRNVGYDPWAVHRFGQSGGY